MFDKKTLFILLVIALCFWFTTNYGSSRNSGTGTAVVMGTEEGPTSTDPIEHADHEIIDQDILDAKLLLINEQEKADQNKVEQTDSTSPSSTTKTPAIIPDSDQATLITEDKVKLGVIKELVLKVFPESSEDDIKVWQEELADTAPEIALGILQLRKKANATLFNLPKISTKGLDLPPLPIDQDSSPPQQPAADEPNLGQQDVFPENVHINEPLGATPAHLRPLWKAAQSVCFQNLENMFSPGYKRLYLKSHSSGPLSSESLSTQEAGPLAHTQLEMNQGEIQKTGNSLDFAIEGEGFFGVKDPQEGTVFYSRNGQFTLNKERHLCLKSGGTFYPVQPSLHVPANPTSLHLLSNGALITHTSEGTAETIGMLHLYQFSSPENLSPSENGLLAQTPSAGEAKAFEISSLDDVRILQGCLEMSNVNSRQELELLRQHKLQWQAINEAAAIIQSP